MPRVGPILLGAVLVLGSATPNTVSLGRLEGARQLKRQGSFKEAARAYEAAMPQVRSSGERVELAQALLEYSQTSLAVGAYATALKNAQEAAGIFHSLKDIVRQAQAINVLGSSQLYSGDYDGAVHTFESALQLDRQQHDARGEITRLSNIGNVYFFQGKYLDALTNYELALRRVKETAAEPWNASRRELVLTNLATLYEQLGQNQKALDYYLEALAGADQMPVNEHAQLLSNVGTLYRRLGDAVKALKTYDDARRLYSQEHLSDGEIYVLQNVGIAEALDFRDLRKAVAAFTEALRLAEASSNRREAALAHLFRGEAYYRVDRTTDAERDFRAALTAAGEIGAKEEQWTALYGIGRIERSRGENARARETFRQAIAIIESVRSGLDNSSLKASFLADKRQVYDAAIDLMLAEKGNEAARSPRLFAMFEEARARNLQDSLGSVKPALEKIQSKLQRGVMLLEYWMGNDRFAVLWVTKNDTGVTSYPLSEMDRTSISEFSKRLMDANDPAWKDTAARLGHLLVADSPLNRDVTQLLIVPDGILSQIPFEVLATQLGEPLLVERFCDYLPAFGGLAVTRGTSRHANAALAPAFDRLWRSCGRPQEHPSRR